MYLCGTKYDLVEENKKLRKIDSGTIKDYGDGMLGVCVLVGMSLGCVHAQRFKPSTLRLLPRLAII